MAVMSEVPAKEEFGRGLGGISRRSLLSQALLLSLSGCAGMWRGEAFRAPPSTPRYDMQVRLDPAQRLMHVSGIARFPASAHARQDLRLVLAPLAREVTFSCRDRRG